MLTWKHSQYFFWQNDFLQLQPRRCADGMTAASAEVGKILGWNAVGLRSCIERFVASTTSLHDKKSHCSENKSVCAYPQGRCNEHAHPDWGCASS